MFFASVISVFGTQSNICDRGFYKKTLLFPYVFRCSLKCIWNPVEHLRQRFFTKIVNWIPLLIIFAKKLYHRFTTGLHYTSLTGEWLQKSFRISLSILAFLINFHRFFGFFNISLLQRN